MTAQQMRFRTVLAGVAARDIMTRECMRVPAEVSVQDLVDRHMFRTGGRCAMVVDGDHLQGLVTLHEVKQMPRSEWTSTPVRAVAVSGDRLVRATPETPVQVVAQMMDENNVSQVPVVEDDRFLGVIGRDRLLALVQTRMDLKA